MRELLSTIKSKKDLLKAIDLVDTYILGSKKDVLDVVGIKVSSLEEARELKTELLEIPEVEINMPFEITSSFISRVYDLLRPIFDRHFVVNGRLDRLSGFKISALINGRYFESNLKANILSFLKDRHAIEGL